jgi:hypothetical protein
MQWVCGGPRQFFSLMIHRVPWSEVSKKKIIPSVLQHHPKAMPCIEVEVPIPLR